MKKDCFEYNVNEVDNIIEKLESGELLLDEAIKEYEKAMKLLEKSSKILNNAEGKIVKVTETNGNINLEVDESV